MTSKFMWHACGAVRDRHELEYISALAQSGDTIRRDGTISAEDIQLFLKSRHGLIVKLELVEEALKDLVGNIPRSSPHQQHQEEEKEPKCFLDIPSLASLLMIPFLLRMNDSDEEKEDHDLEEGDYKDDSKFDQGTDIFARVLEILRDDLSSSLSSHSIGTSPKLTKDLLRQLFYMYGETQISDDLLEEMLLLPFSSFSKCTGSNQRYNDELCLDRNTFAKALTFDIQKYNFHLETRFSSFFQDFLTMVRDSPMDHSDQNNDYQNNPTATKDTSSTSSAFEEIYTASHVDMSADRMQSDNFIIVFYLNICVYCVAYFSGYGYIDELLQCSQFSCHVGAAIADWLFIFLEVGVLGATLAYFVSASPWLTLNQSMKSQRSHRNWSILKQILGLGTLAFFTSAPFVRRGISNPLFSNESRDGLEWASYFVFATGLLMLYVQFSIIFRYFFPNVTWLYTPECTKRKERFTKSASRLKVERFYQNAISLHSPELSSLEDSSPGIQNERLQRSKSDVHRGSSQFALLEYEKREDEMEPMTGHENWRIWNLTHPIYEEEGVWVGARIWAGNLGQIVAVFGFAYFIAYLNQSVTKSFQDSSLSTATINIVRPSISRALYYNSSGSFVLNTKEVTPKFMSHHNLTFGYPFDTAVEIQQMTRAESFMANLLRALQISQDVTAIWGVDTVDDLLNQVNGALFNSTGIDLKLAFEYIDLYASFRGNFVSFVIEQGKKRVTVTEIRTALLFGGVCGTLAMIFVTATYFPSGIAQILMLRHGAMSPLTDVNFSKLRVSPYATTFLFGGAIWGVLATGFATAVVTGGILFFAVWSQSTSFVVGFLAMLIGLTISLIIRVVIVFSVRGIAHSAFYRNKPILSNVVTVVLECWSIAVAFGFIVSRSLKLIIATCLYLGRIDTHFLAPTVNQVNKQITVDAYPDSFTVDLLLHDAHRHPYLERLGLIYMLKIHDRQFATRAGCCWRLLFTLALCPWLHRHRGKDYNLHSMMQKKKLIDLRFSSSK